MDKYGLEMIKAASSIEGMSVRDLIKSDFKNYVVGSKNLGIGQVMTLDFDRIKENMDEYVNEYDLKERIDKFNLSYIQEKKLMRKDEEFIKDKVTFKYYYNIDKIVYEYQMFFYETKDNLKTINNSYVSEYIVS